VIKNSSRLNLKWKKKLLKMKKKLQKQNSKRTGDIVATEDADITDIVIDITEDAIEDAIEYILMMVRLTSKNKLTRSSSVTKLILLMKNKVKKSLRKNSKTTTDIVVIDTAVTTIIGTV